MSNVYLRNMVHSLWYDHDTLPFHWGFYRFRGGILRNVGSTFLFMIGLFTLYAYLYFNV